MMSSTATDIPRQEPQKSHHTILEQHVRQAHEELERPAGALLLSGLSAGLDLGFGPFLMAVIATLTSDELPHSLTQILVSLAYVVGFIFVVIGRSAGSITRSPAPSRCSWPLLQAPVPPLQTMAVSSSGPCWATRLEAPFSWQF